MPMTTVAKDSSPAVVCIAGIYPGLTEAQLLAPTPVPFAPPGTWTYHMLAGDAAPGGFVAIPGSSLLDCHPDTVAIVSNGGAIGVEFADSNEHEVLVLVDRSDAATFDRSEFDKESFYVFADPEGTVHIRWHKELPADWRILGKVLYTQMPFVKRPGAGGGFAELSDEFEYVAMRPLTHAHRSLIAHATARAAMPTRTVLRPRRLD